MANNDPYDRQKRIRGWNQEALSRARVLVLGAGALGNETLKNLALVGVGHLMTVDFDLIEASNLSRTVLFREGDVGCPKAKIAAARAAELNPAIEVQYLDGDLFYDLGLGFYRHCNMAIGCLDSLAARSRVGVSCALSGIPYLDGGVWSMGGEARWFMPGPGPCFECALGAGDRARAYERRSCTGYRRAEAAEPPAATSILSSAVIGGILAQTAVQYLCGFDVFGGEAAVYNGVRVAMHRSGLSRDPGCPYHRAYEGVATLESGVRDVSATDLLRGLGAAAVLELGRDYLVAFLCSACGNRENVGAHLGRVGEERARCPVCGGWRSPEVVSGLDAAHPLAHRPLAELGVPPGEVVAVRAGDGLRLFELTGDVTRFWAKPGRDAVS